MKSSNKKALVLALMYAGTLALCVLQRPAFGLITFMLHGMVIVYATVVGVSVREFVTNGGWWMAPIALSGVGGLYCLANAILLHDGISPQTSSTVFIVCMFAGMVAHSIRNKPHWGILCLRGLGR